MPGRLLLWYNFHYSFFSHVRSTGKCFRCWRKIQGSVVFVERLRPAWGSKPTRDKSLWGSSELDSERFINVAQTVNYFFVRVQVAKYCFQ